MQQAVLAQRFGAIWRATPARLDPDIGAQIELGFGISGTRMMEVMKLGESVRGSFPRFFDWTHGDGGFDALLCPASPVKAWPLGSLGPSEIGGLPAGPRGHAAFTPIFNDGGVPGIPLPYSTGRPGLSVRLEIAA